jgi:hypothetical protein
MGGGGEQLEGKTSQRHATYQQPDLVHNALSGLLMEPLHCRGLDAFVRHETKSVVTGPGNGSFGS